MAPECTASPPPKTTARPTPTEGANGPPPGAPGGKDTVRCHGFIRTWLAAHKRGIQGSVPRVGHGTCPGTGPRGRACRPLDRRATRTVHADAVARPAAQ